MIDRLYSRALALAGSRHAMWALAAVSFAESSFFPLPPDILLIPMILARPRGVSPGFSLIKTWSRRDVHWLEALWEWFWAQIACLVLAIIEFLASRACLIAAVCTGASVLGGLVGYAIGYFLFDAVGRPVLEFYQAMDKYETLKEAFAQWGAWIIILKGLTPIPFKLVTIASGVAQFDLAAFVLASLVSRSLRFFLLAALLWWFGDPVREFIERRLMLVTSAFAAALIGGFLVLRYL